MRAWILAGLFLLVNAGCGGLKEDGATCATSDDCINECIDAVCSTPRGESELCAHGGQCGRGMECTSWNNKGYCTLRCVDDDVCGDDRDCEDVFTVAGEMVRVCEPAGLGPQVSCHQGCERACNDASQACSLCKQACRCACSQDQECADLASAEACNLGLCGC